ncbi:MAG: arylsulfatase [Bacteroidota bacterium]
MKDIIALWVICSLFACQDHQKQQAGIPPNIIYVLADDLGYGDISALNENGKIQTPNIDKLVAEGMNFTDAHSASAVCTPTRYTILTGRYSWRTKLKAGVLTGKSKAMIPNNRTTVASMLQNHGYQTAFIGKWHLGWDWALMTDTLGGSGWGPNDFDNIDFTKTVTNTPNDVGFDYAYGHSGSLDMAPYVYVENGEITAEPNRTTVDTAKYTWWRQGPTGTDFIHEEVTPNCFNRAIEYVNKKTDDQPFFLYLALPSPHTPILPTEEWQGKSGLNPYADFVVMIDDYMGKLVAVLEEKGLTDNTLVIFTSDNGCSPEADFAVLGEKGHDPSYIFRGQKADIFEGGHRVPFIAKWPAKIAEGQTSNQLVCSTDFMATCADIIDYELADNEGEDSYSLLPLFEQQGAKYQRKDMIHHSVIGTFAIRQGDWKLIMDAGSGGWSFPNYKEVAAIDTLPPVQLYNIKNDPAEAINLQASEPQIVAKLTDLLSQQILNGRSTIGKPQPNDTYDGEWKQAAFAIKKITTNE